MSVNDKVFVDSVTKLAEICEILAQSPAVAVDTEFTRDKTYYPELGLIQLASDRLVALIDPQQIEDLTPLALLFTQPGISKILHAARQDVEVIWYRLRLAPAPIFDTQIAAGFLGLHEQISYAALVLRYCNITLDKAHTRTDWCRRPLSPEQLHYAAEDVYYLIRLYPVIREELQARGRLTWCEQESARLSALVPSDAIPADLWQGVNGQQYLKPQQLAILRALTHWREQRARQSNRPRQWIVRDEVLIALAQCMPGTLAQLGSIEAMPATLIERHGDTLLQLIGAAAALPPAQWPAASNREPLTVEQKNQLQRLSQRVRELAEQQQIAAPLLATRRDLERLITRGEDIPLLHDWRLELAGEEIRKLLP